MRMTRFAAWFDRQSGAAFELRFFRVKSNRGEMMKLTAVLNTAILFLLSGAIVPAYPQEREEGKRPEEKQQQARPAHRQQEAKPPERQTQQIQRQQPAKTTQQQQQHAARRQQAQPAQQQQRGQEHQRASQSQPAADHGRVPEDRFRASFGRGHTFHVNRSEFANGSRRFQYGGY